MTQFYTDPKMSFAPIAIVGRSCVLPKAFSPEELWARIQRQESLITEVAADRWRVDHDDITSSASEATPDRTWSVKGGYVEGFEEHFTPENLSLSEEQKDDILGLDPLFHWVLHTVEQALNDGARIQGQRTGLIMGNLSFPTASMSQLSEETWFPEFSTKVSPGNRFMSGYPALLMKKIFSLDGPVFALDSACASALYAIRLACDALHDGSADLMLAGAVNRADDLFIHVGFSALQALSKTGQSQPFSADADGLLPAEGASFVLLKRLLL